MLLSRQAACLPANKSRFPQHNIFPENSQKRKTSSLPYYEALLSRPFSLISSTLELPTHVLEPNVAYSELNSTLDDNNTTIQSCYSNETHLLTTVSTKEPEPLASSLKTLHSPIPQPANLHDTIDNDTFPQTLYINSVE